MARKRTIPKPFGTMPLWMWTPRRIISLPIWRGSAISSILPAGVVIVTLMIGSSVGSLKSKAIWSNAHIRRLYPIGYGTSSGVPVLHGHIVLDSTPQKTNATVMHLVAVSAGAASCGWRRLLLVCLLLELVPRHLQTTWRDGTFTQPIIKARRPDALPSAPSGTVCKLVSQLTDVSNG